ncbi:MAG: hypothetical protein ACI4L9_03425, partial [Candidatus Coproplasma sp.]
MPKPMTKQEFYDKYCKVSGESFYLRNFEENIRRMHEKYPDEKDFNQAYFDYFKRALKDAYADQIALYQTTKNPGYSLVEINNDLMSVFDGLAVGVPKVRELDVPGAFFSMHRDILNSFPQTNSDFAMESINAIGKNPPENVNDYYREHNELPLDYKLKRAENLVINIMYNFEIDEFEFQNYFDDKREFIVGDIIDSSAVRENIRPEDGPDSMPAIQLEPRFHVATDIYKGLKEEHASRSFLWKLAHPIDNFREWNTLRRMKNSIVEWRVMCGKSEDEAKAEINSRLEDNSKTAFMKSEEQAIIKNNNVERDKFDFEQIVKNDKITNDVIKSGERRNKDFTDLPEEEVNEFADLRDALEPDHDNAFND